MKVILIENIDKVGSKGDVISVKRGFARNYLIPRNYAIYATPINLKNVESMKTRFAADEAKKLEQLRQTADTISGLRLSFNRKVDEHDNLYGSVSDTDIMHALQDKSIDIPKAALIMEKPIKALGEFEVPVRLHKDILVSLHGVVEKESE